MKIFYWLGIKFYQHVISPRKGFNCAYSKVHGGSGCSGAILRILMTKGIKMGGHDIINRLDACKIAHKHLYLSASGQNKDLGRKKDDRNKECGLDCLDSACDLISIDKCSCDDIGGCDISLSLLLRRFL